VAASAGYPGAHRLQRCGEQREAWPARLGDRTSNSWLTGYRRLTIRYERNADHFLAFLIFATAITCFKKLRKLAT
jgi:hypothetical protein